MSNRSTIQLPVVSDQDATDVLHISRDIAGVQSDRHIIREDAVPLWYTQQTLILSADVLTLNTTPVEVVPAPAADEYLIPRYLTVKFLNGTVDYATNVTLKLGPTGLVGSTYFTHTSDISDMSTTKCSVPSSTGTASSAIAIGVGLSVMVLTGDPTAGDSDIVVTVHYQKTHA